ncbi:MAG: hypothetical protein VXZ35_07490, partial [Pseudomonadota bacterium]|nr:hypothetical protein [Pseudomonadota bacterium]
MWKTRQSSYKALGLALAASLAAAVFASQTDASDYGEPSQPVWRMASLNWQPYAGAELVDQGSAVQKLRQVLAGADITLHVEFFPWKRAQELAKTDDYLGYFPAWPEEVYPGFIASDAVAWSQVGVLKKSGTEVSYSDVDDLFMKYRVGVVSTYTYPNVVAAAMQKYPQHVDGSMSEILLVRKLCGGRHPVAITDPRVMMYLAAQENITNIEPVGLITQKELVV